MARSANIGSIQYGIDYIMHPQYPHFEITMPIDAGAACPAGAILQIGDTRTLVPGDFTKRSYILVEDTDAETTEANVAVLGAARMDKLQKAVIDADTGDVTLTAITEAEAIEMMETGPIVCV
jgi:hypothetical protein